MASKNFKTNMRLFKAHTKHYYKTKSKKLLKFSKTAERPAKWNKIHINDQKPTNHYQNSPKNITGSLPEHSRNSFVDMQSNKNSKKERPKNSLFIEG